MPFFTPRTTEATGTRPTSLFKQRSSRRSPRMELPLLLPGSLDKALLLQAYTRLQMLALRGSRGQMFWRWISNVWKQREAMCSHLHCLRPFFPRILVRLGDPARQVTALRLAAGSPPIRYRAIRSSLETQRACSYRPTAVHPGRISTKDFRHARYLQWRPLVPMTITYLPALSVKAFGVNQRERERQRRLQLRLQRQLQPR